MKKQNVNNKLAFGKATVTELNNNQMMGVNGGTFTFFPSIITVTTIINDLEALANGGSQN